MPLVVVPQITVDPVLLIKQNFPPEMIPVIKCESSFHQFNADGTPNISPTHDVGIMQINHVHWIEAKNLGLDIFHSIDDNVKMGKIIFAEQGLGGWNCSKK
jgi:hypothetical protein